MAKTTKAAPPDDKAAALDKARKASATKVASFLADFAGDPPHEAESGDYAFNGRDRWHGRKIGALDGWHHGSGWAVRIVGGKPVEAVRADHSRYPGAPASNGPVGSANSLQAAS